MPDARRRTRSDATQPRAVYYGGTPASTSVISSPNIFDPTLAGSNPTPGQSSDLPWWLVGLGGAAGTVLSGGDFGDATCAFLASLGIPCPGGSTPSGGGFAPTNGTGPCPTGAVKVGDRCVFPGDIFPGGDPFITGAGQQPVVDDFGRPALTPTREAVPTLRCGPGMVLGRNNLCYEKSSISVRDRKWRPKPKPPISAGDAKAIRRADRAKNRVKRLATKSGFVCRKR